MLLQVTRDRLDKLELVDSLPREREASLLLEDPLLYPPVDHGELDRGGDEFGMALDSVGNFL